MTNPERTIVYIDGNNWFHGLKQIGVADRYLLNYAKISSKIIGPGRQWLATRYYIGQVRQEDDKEQYANQRKFLAAMTATDKRISTHLGRLEPRHVENDLAKEMKFYLANLTVKIDTGVYQRLIRMADRYKTSRVMVEKAIDVMLAIDLVVMAEHNLYDTAYILSADGDYTPAVNHVNSLGKKVFAASTLHGAELAKAVYKFIPLDTAWFGDCY